MSSQNPVTREEFTALLDHLKDGVDKCVRLLELQNSRLHKAEIAVAILNDRQPARQAVTWGASAGALAAAFIALVDFLIKTF